MAKRVIKNHRMTADEMCCLYGLGEPNRSDLRVLQEMVERERAE